MCEQRLSQQDRLLFCARGWSRRSLLVWIKSVYCLRQAAECMSAAYQMQQQGLLGHGWLLPGIVETSL